MLERDLKAVRAKRAEREKATGATRLQEESQKSLERTTHPLSTSSLDVDLTINDTTVGLENSSSENVLNTEDPSRTVKTILGQSDDAPEVQNRTSDEHAMDMSQDYLDLAEKLESQGETKQLAQLETPIEENIAPQEISVSTSKVEGSLETPTTANLRDAQFDSMFNDAELSGGTESIDFFDFSGEGDIGQELVNDNPFGTMAAGADGFSNLNAASNEDINTLLPGLDSYVNASDNFIMDIPNATGKTSTNQTVETAKHSVGAECEAPMESSFDDLFNYGTADIEMGGTDGDMGGDDNGSIGDFGEFEQFFDLP